VTSTTYVKLFIGLVLFGSLVALTVLDVPHAERLIDLIYASLLGLGITHLAGPGPSAPGNKEGGFAHPGLLAAMGVGAILLLSGCVTTSTAQPAAQTAQVSYTQACVAYGAVFAGALELRRAGRLSRAQIDQVTLLDSQITPLCTGPLPADSTAAVQQVTTAVTTLTLLEIAQKAN
jgi:hypothetical protein